MKNKRHKISSLFISLLHPDLCCVDQWDDLTHLVNPAKRSWGEGMSLLSSLWFSISRYLPEYFPLQLCVIYFLWSRLWSQPSILLFDFLSFCLHHLVCMSDSLETLSLIEHSNSVFCFQSKLITYFYRFILRY